MIAPILPSPVIACMEPAPYLMLLIITAIAAAPVGLLGWIVGSMLKDKTPAFWLAFAGTALSAGIMIGVIVWEAYLDAQASLLLIVPLASLACAARGFILRRRHPDGWRAPHFWAGAGAALLTAMLAVMVMG